MIDREPLKSNLNAGRKPEKAILRNLGARYGPCSLASRARTAHGRLSRADNLGSLGSEQAEGRTGQWISRIGASGMQSRP
jgi:hypothetical protein